MSQPLWKTSLNAPYKITGTITEKYSNKPLFGVIVKIKGTSIGTKTDFDGNFTLLSESPEIPIEVSFLGYEKYHKYVNYKSPLNIVLKPSSEVLDEVVIETGYGSSPKPRKNRFGFSLKKSRVMCPVFDELGTETNISFDQMLQGQAPGLIITSADGQPGAATNIRIRSTDSYNDNSKFSVPKIYIIDGKEFDPGAFGLPKNANPLKYMDLDQIVSKSTVQFITYINTKDGNGFQISEELFMELISSQKKVTRKKFSDIAFWQPILSTDENGKASFKTILPDDETSWEIYVQAIQGVDQYMSYQGKIKSYKSISNKLKTPEFLCNEDSICLIGETQNFTQRNIDVNTTVSINDSLTYSFNKSMTAYSQDTFQIKLHDTTSIKIKYESKIYEKPIDGIEKTITVKSPTVNIATGKFLHVNADTSLDFTLNPSSNYHILIEASKLDFIHKRAQELAKYPHSCNEQKASKLIALILTKKLSSITNTPFKKKYQIKKLISELEDNQNSEGAWGWWGKSNNSSAWITKHITNALTIAKADGFNVKHSKISPYTVDILHKNYDHKLEALTMADNLTKTHIKYIKSVNADSLYKANVYKYAILMSIRKNAGLDFSFEKILKNNKVLTYKSGIGFSLWNDSVNNIHLLQSDVNLTLKMHEILREDSSYHSLCDSIQNYIIHKGISIWENTYYSAKALYVLAEDLKPHKTNALNKVKISSQGQITTSETFPYEYQINRKPSISIDFKTEFEQFFTLYERKPIEPYVSNDSLFNIETSFAKSNIERGDKTSILIKISAKIEMDHAMITIPIPAGVEFPLDQPRIGGAVHQVYHRDKIVLYVENIHQGFNTFTIPVKAVFAGKFTMPASKIENMYFPTLNGYNISKKVEIK